MPTSAAHGRLEFTAGATVPPSATAPGGTARNGPDPGNAPPGDRSQARRSRKPGAPPRLARPRRPARPRRRALRSPSAARALRSRRAASNASPGGDQWPGQRLRRLEPTKHEAGAGRGSRRRPQRPNPPSATSTPARGRPSARRHACRGRRTDSHRPGVARANRALLAAVRRPRQSSAAPSRR